MKKNPLIVLMLRSGEDAEEGSKRVVKQLGTREKLVSVRYSLSWISQVQHGTGIFKIGVAGTISS